MQAGLQEWSEGHCSRPPTWTVLLDAMGHGGIACQHIASLKEELLRKRGILTVCLFPYILLLSEVLHTPEIIDYHAIFLSFQLFVTCT